MTSDQRGLSRPQDGDGDGVAQRDIGAFERVGVCGNNTLEGIEECDDGNNEDNDGCSSLCETEVPPSVCGNGAVEGSEQCDDNNTNDGDGCSSTCKIETTHCTNGVQELGEECDDGNLIDTDSCSNACTLNEAAPALSECGNGIQEAGETCDDGNTLDGDGCTSACLRHTYDSQTGGCFLGIAGNPSYALLSFLAFLISILAFRLHRKKTI